MPRIVCLSDTHNCHDQITVPDGDILIHAGDATIRGTHSEVEDFLSWFSRLPHRHKIFVAGNHDWLFETENEFARILSAKFNLNYLQDSSIEIGNLKVYGSPWQPRFYDWAFNLNRGAEIAEKWAVIPDETDILITHGPPCGILDQTPRGDNAGCEELYKRVIEINPKMHIFGHIHLGYGKLKTAATIFVNASNCNENYEPTNPPIIVDL